MPDRVAEHYDRHAHAFDTARRRNFAEKDWFDRFLIGLPAHSAILDLGCGGGEPVDRYLVDRGHRLTGVDVSAKMVALARTRFPRHLWLHADMRKAAMGQRFRGIVAWDSLFHLPLPDQTAMLEKIARWLEPEGMLLFNSGPEAGERVGRQLADDLYHASLSPEHYRAIFAEHGLTEIAFRPDDPGASGRSVWLARKFA